MRSLLRFTAVAALLACSALPASAAADPVGEQAVVARLTTVHVDLPVVSAAVVSGPLAQLDAPAPADVAQLDPDFQLVLQGLTKAFSADGKPNWIIIAPLLVFALVLIARRYLTGAIPWLGTTAGGYALNIGFSLGFAFLSFALKGGHFDAPSVISLLFQVAYNFGTSYLLHHTQRDVREKILAKGELAAAVVTNGDQAAAKLEQLGRGPQP